MTDAQIVTLALVFVAALAAVLFNNSRITDLRADSNLRMSEFRADSNLRMNELRADSNLHASELRADMNKRFDDVSKRFDDVNRHIDDKFTLLTVRMDRMEDNLTRLIGDHETRLQKLENKDNGR